MVLKLYTVKNILIISWKKREIFHIGLLHEHYPFKTTLYRLWIPLFSEEIKEPSLNKPNKPLSSLIQSSLISDSGIMRPLKEIYQNINLYHKHL